MSLDYNDAYRAYVEEKGYETDIRSAKGDYLFLLDRSGSMGGSRIEKAKEALIIFLRSLPIDSFLNVVSVGFTSEELYENNIIQWTFLKLKI